MSGRKPYLALLRGINVGGKHRLPMKDLAAIFAECSCVDVRTFIQSGNVIFTATPSGAKQLPKSVSAKIEQRFGFPVPVILRGLEELSEAVEHNPFAKQGLPEPLLHVYFLADVPTAAAVKTLDPARSAPDAFRVVGRHVYLHLPNGMGRSKLTNAYFDSKLSTVSTARNWATTKSLLEMMQG